MKSTSHKLRLAANSWLGLSLLCSLLSLLISTSTLAEPQVTTPGSEFNFGMIPQSSIVSHTFWVHSNSSDTLTIDTVVSSCGCTSIPLSDPALAPGDSLALTMEFRSFGFIGQVVKRPYFHLVGDTTTYYLKFYARVVMNPAELYPLASYPPIIDFTVRSNQQSDTRLFALKNSAEETIGISIVDQPTGYIQISVPDSLRAGEIYEGLISLNPRFLGIKFENSLTIEVNGSELYRLSIPLTSGGDTRFDQPDSTR